MYVREERMSLQNFKRRIVFEDSSGEADESVAIEVAKGTK